MNDENSKLSLLIAGALGAALFGAMTFLSNVSSAAPNRRGLMILIGTWLVGVGFGGFAGWYWAEAIQGSLVAWGVKDSVAVAAFLGVVCVPLAPVIVKALQARAQRKIEGV